MINSMVLPLRIEPYQKISPVFWTYSIHDKAKIFDNAGFEVAEVETMFVANEICSILNHHGEVIEALTSASCQLKECGITNKQIDKVLQRCEEIYKSKKYYNDSFLDGDTNQSLN